MFKRKSKSDKPAKAAKPKKEKAPRKKREKPAKKAKVALGPVKKQPSDIYTVMLVISTVAVLIACVLLLLELNRFGSYPWWKAG